MRGLGYANFFGVLLTVCAWTLTLDEWSARCPRWKLEVERVRKGAAARGLQAW